MLNITCWCVDTYIQILQDVDTKISNIRWVRTAPDLPRQGWGREVWRVDSGQVLLLQGEGPGGPPHSQVQGRYLERLLPSVHRSVQVPEVSTSPTGQYKSQRSVERRSSRIPDPEIERHVGRFISKFTTSTYNSSKKRFCLGENRLKLTKTFSA